MNQRTFAVVDSPVVEVWAMRVEWKTRERVSRESVRLMLGWIVTQRVVIDGQPVRESVVGAYAATIPQAVFGALVKLGAVKLRTRNATVAQVWDQRHAHADLAARQLMVHPVYAH